MCSVNFVINPNLGARAEKSRLPDNSLLNLVGSKFRIRTLQCKFIGARRPSVIGLKIARATCTPACVLKWGWPFKQNDPIRTKSWQPLLTLSKLRLIFWASHFLCVLCLEYWSDLIKPRWSYLAVIHNLWRL